VWTVLVEVTLVLAEDAASVTFVVDQHPVGAFSADAPNEPFRVAVGPGRPRWSPDHLHAFGGEYLVKAAGELRVSVADQEPKGRGSRTQIHDQVAGLLGCPCGRWVGGDAEDVHAPGSDLHHHQHVQPSQGDGVDVEEVGREQPGRLRSQEGPPAGVELAGRWPDPAGGEDPADGAGADPVTEPDELPLYGESAWGAVIGFPRFRFPRPLSEPGVRLSPHRALHGIMSLV
jgi:hypothetical protein